MMTFLFPFLLALTATPSKTATIRTDRLALSIEYGNRASITSMTLNGKKLIDAPDGAFTSVRIGDTAFSSLHLLAMPVLTTFGDTTTLKHIVYGDSRVEVNETWVFIASNKSIQWRIERTLPQPVHLDESATPEMNFDRIADWDGAYQGYGGLAWFYLFSERLCTYGVHTGSSSFWNSKTGDGLDVVVTAPKRQVAMKYSRTTTDRLAYTITAADREMLPRYDSGTNRRRFIRGKTDVWAPFDEARGTSTTAVTFSYFDVAARYDRGHFAGVDGDRVAAVLNTIARIGVIDSLHFGGNSWHTPYGPICLHEQYIAQMGLAIDDPHYLRGYQSCLDFYRDHAIKPDGRVFARWAYNDEDMMPGQGNKYGFYEAQWGILMDANPDFVTNVSELFDLTGDKVWVKGQQHACEKALDWILARDSNGNGLVEMMTDSEKQKRGSDWIDIIWASYENAFVNAKLYHALLKWSAIERQLANPAKAGGYEAFARKLKASFNRPTKEGGFWDEDRHCYVHWLDKNGSPHGANMVTPVNFMAIAYGICDDSIRRTAILDSIELQMQREQLFFWPLCMTTYAPGDGNDWQFPFPNYENGDIFLSWGSVAAAAYAPYRPDIAVKYIRKVLDQYGKDGLAFQRYGRRKQDGLGDDILSGNCLSIVGLYQAIYGINPLYNRFYLNPHLTPELNGTTLKYHFRGDLLIIGLSRNDYSVSGGKFRIQASTDFGFSHRGDSLFYFFSNESAPSLKAISRDSLSIAVRQWTRDRRQWTQAAPGEVHYLIYGLAPATVYDYYADGKKLRDLRSNLKGEIRLSSPPSATEISLDDHAARDSRQ